jgi:hypothetical protein
MKVMGLDVIIRESKGMVEAYIKGEKEKFTLNSKEER